MSDEQMTCPESGETFTPCAWRIGSQRVLCGAPAIGRVDDKPICINCRYAFFRLGQVTPL